MVSITTRLLGAATVIHVIQGYTTSSSGQHSHTVNLPPNQYVSSAVDSNANNAMAQYEAALKAAFESTSVPLTASIPLGTSNKSFPTIRYERDIQIDHNPDPGMILSSLDEKGGRVADTPSTSVSSVSWDILTQEIHARIDAAEVEGGTPLTEDAEDDIIATVVAGSDLGTALGSPLLVGATLGYAGTQLLQGEKAGQTKEVLGKVGREILDRAKVQANAAFTYTKEHLHADGEVGLQQIQQEPSKVTKKILLAIQERAHQVHEDIQAGPTQLVENLKRSVQREDLKTLPNRSFKALHAFLGSDEVQDARNRAIQAIKDGLESDEMKALQNRAAQAVRDTLHPKAE
jgi:gas vesicle protein